jgi:hypothetical protein
VDKGLTALLGTDPTYGKLIAKNPFHSRWIVYVWHEKAWGLTELIEWIPDRLLRQKQPQRETIGLGRNCTVFEVARSFAYSERRRQKFADEARLFERVHDFSMNVNAGFNVPMLPQEVKSIVRSITKWTARHLVREGFGRWGDKRRERSIIVRHTKSEDRAVGIKMFKEEHPDKSNRQIALALGYALDTVNRALRRGIK